MTGKICQLLFHAAPFSASADEVSTNIEAADPFSTERKSLNKNFLHICLTSLRLIHQRTAKWLFFNFK